MSTERTPSLHIAALAVTMGASLALGGCSTNAGGPVQVTRFHLAEPIAPGSFWVVSGPTIGQPTALAPDSLELQSYNDAVAGELSRLGFTRAADAASAELSVAVSVDRGTRPDPRPHGAAVSFGIGGASFGRHSGFGADTGVTVPVGGRSEHFLVGTRMMVQIKRRSEGTVIWEGRAMTEAPGTSPDASPQAAVGKLAHAIFSGFPGESGRTITVK